jgi:hypothetical protein
VLLVLKKHGCSSAALSSFVADHKLRDTGLDAVQLYQLMGDSAFNGTQAALNKVPLPATTAAPAVTQHWLQALDHGPGTDVNHPFKHFQALDIARKALVHAHAAQGLAGLLQTCPASVTALQGVLPFMQPPHQLIMQQCSLQERMQQAQQQQQQQQQYNPQLHRSSSSSAGISQQLDGGSSSLPSLLELPPPAQQAWLFADVVAGLLLLDQQGDQASSSSSSDKSSTTPR